MKNVLVTPARNRSKTWDSSVGKQCCPGDKGAKRAGSDCLENDMEEMSGSKDLESCSPGM